MICALYVCITLLTSGTHLSLYICLRAALYPSSSSSSSSSLSQLGLGHQNETILFYDC